MEPRPRLTAQRIVNTVKENKKRLSILFIIILVALYTFVIPPTLQPRSLHLGKVKIWVPDAAYFLSLRRHRVNLIHPIPKLMADAQTRYKKLLGRQSLTLLQAVHEYKRRYGRDPPKGFDEWFAFAKQLNGVKMIDEYGSSPPSRSSERPV